MATPVLVCATHQPNLFPRLSTLAKLYLADRWVILDNVQFVRRDYQHRCRVGTPGAAQTHQWLTLPVHLPRGRATPIDQVTLADQPIGRRRVEQLLAQHYGRYPYWHQLRPIVEAIGTLITDSNRLHEIAIASAKMLLEMMRWTGQIEHSSQFNVSTERSERLADLAAAVAADTYLCGTGGANYLNEHPFDERSIRVHYLQIPTTEPSAVWTDHRRLTAIAALSLHGLDTVRSEIRRLPNAEPSHLAEPSDPSRRR